MSKDKSKDNSKKKDKKKKSKPAPTTASGIFWENLKVFASALVIALIIKTSVVEAYKVPTGSMEDTILVGDFLFANKFLYGAKIPLINVRFPAIREPEQGDIIVFTYPVDRKTDFIKRCVALPGQTVEIKDKVLYVDGEIYADAPDGKYVDPNIMPRQASGQYSRDNWGPYVVPVDAYFMMGDNRDRSSDSRFWGPVHRDFIQGKALFIHWSWAPDDNAPVVSALEPNSVPRLFLYNTVHLYERVRWGRLFSLLE